MKKKKKKFFFVNGKKNDVHFKTNYCNTYVVKFLKVTWRNYEDPPNNLF